MARITAPRVESSGEFEHKQIVRLPNGLYGGMFAWYSLPKAYQKFQSSETEEKFFVGFVVTHDRAYRQLPAFSEAIMGVRLKRFFDFETGMKSAYVTLLHALFGGKKSYIEIDAMSDDELPDFDTFIGRPATLFIEANTKPDKNGLYGHRLKGLEPADKELIAAIKPLYQTKQVETTEKGIARLVIPCAAYEADVPGGTPATETDDDFDPDEIPF